MTAKIYIARKDIAVAFEHSYLVFDPDGDPYSGDERIIRGGTTRTDGALGGPYLIEADRAVDISRDSLSDGKSDPNDPDFDPYGDRYYTTVASGDIADIQDIWDGMVAKAESLGNEEDDPWSGDDNITIPANTPAYVLPEDQYQPFDDNCNSLTATILRAAGYEMSDNLPKVGGDTGSGERMPEGQYIESDAEFTSRGDDTIDVPPAVTAIFDQGGSDTYEIDPADHPKGTIQILEDDNIGTDDEIILQNVDPNDVRFEQTPRAWTQ